MEVPGKTKRQVNTIKWYHGTTKDNLESLIEGARWDYNLGKELDFGAGLYLSNDFSKVCRFVNNTLESENIEGLSDYFSEDSTHIGIVLEYEFDAYSVFFSDNKYQKKVFPKYTDEFVGFIFSCRENPSKVIHDFDIIFGVQSDGKVIQIFEDFREGLISMETAKERLKADTMSFKQLSIQNQELCDKMILRNVYYSKDGKELDWDGYRSNDFHTQENKPNDTNEGR